MGIAARCHNVAIPSPKMAFPASERPLENVLECKTGLAAHYTEAASYASLKTELINCRRVCVCEPFNQLGPARRKRCRSDSKFGDSPPMPLKTSTSENRVRATVRLSYASESGSRLPVTASKAP